MIRDTLTPVCGGSRGVSPRPGGERGMMPSISSSMGGPMKPLRRSSPGTRSRSTPDERWRILTLLEMERQMMMQTSCGWFFDDITEPGASR